MDLRAHGYIVGIVGLLYGTMGYALSLLTCILGAALRQFFPEFTFTQLPARKTPIIFQSPKTLKPRRGRGLSKRTSPARVSKTENASLAGEHLRSLRPPPDADRLRRVSSLDSLVTQQSFVLVAPVITINHVDRVDNTSIKAPTITILPSSTQQPESKTISKRRSLTIAHPSSLPDLPRLPSGEEVRSTSAFRLSSLKPFWGGEKGKPKIHRSVSSPQLNEFMFEKSPAPDSKKENFQDKVQSTLSGKSSKKTLRQEKNLESATSQSSSSKFFSAFPKSAEKKRSQVLRTQPYEAPYFVPPPVPPPPLDDIRRSKGGKRGHTLPPEKLVRPSTAPQRLSKPENI